MVTGLHDRRAAALSAVAVLLALAPAFAAGGDENPPRVSIEPRTTGSPVMRPDIRVDSNLVLIPVSVTDSRNHAVTGLGREMFRIFEGKTEQKLVQFSCEDAPVSVGIVFDSSGSMQSKLAKAREAVAEFLRSANPSDEFFLVNFAARAELAVPFTPNPAEIQNRLMFAQPGGRTALLDAVYLALDYMKNARNARRALVVISDGGDNDSRYTAAELRKRLTETSTWVYAIGIYPRGGAVLPEEERGGPQLLAELSDTAGGRQLAIHKADELPDAAREIARELRNQYVLAYSPESASDGKYHRVQVKIEGRNLHVASRAGYWAPER